MTEENNQPTEENNNTAPTAPTVPTVPTFEELGLNTKMLQSVRHAGFKQPSPVQVLAIPHILAGKDVIGQAHTGTGKTAAFWTSFHSKPS